MTLLRWTGIQGELRLKWPGSILFGQSKADMIFFIELRVNSVLFGSEVGLLFGLKRAYILLSWESTQYLAQGEFKFLLSQESIYCLTQSESISCRIRS